MSYWITFADGSTGCLEAPIPDDYTSNYDWTKHPPFTADNALTLASTLKGVQATKAQPLPYPAQPRLNVQQWPRYGACPSFCYTPTQCAGHSSCPKRISCVD